ncbi:unnamed protein product [Sphagnum compactum]
MCGRFANMPIVHYRGMQWHYWLILFMVALLLHILIIADTAAATTTVDTNQVVNPCAQLQPIKSGDAITVAVAIGGSSVLWYNNSDPLSNLLSPCSPSTATAKVAGLLLVMDFVDGMLTTLSWKDESCAICGNTSALCMDNNCGTAVTTCNAANADPTLCLTRINVAFSGTDKNSVSFSSWMTITSVNKYSLSALYSEAGALLQQGATSIIGSSNGVGTGGQS